MMGDQIDVEIAKIKTSMENLDRRVSNLERAMFGFNDDDGLVSRVSRIEERIQGLSSTSKLSLYLNVGTFLMIVVTLVKLLLG